MSSVSPRRELFAKLSPRLARGDAEGRGRSDFTTATAPSDLDEQDHTPSVAPASPPQGGGEAGAVLLQRSRQAGTSGRLFNHAYCSGRVPRAGRSLQNSPPVLRGEMPKAEGGLTSRLQQRRAIWSSRTRPPPTRGNRGKLAGEPRQARPDSRAPSGPFPGSAGTI